MYLFRELVLVIALGVFSWGFSNSVSYTHLTLPTKA